MGIKIGFQEGLVAMGELLDWSREARDPDSDGGIGITVNELTGLAQRQIEALGFNVVVIPGPEEAQGGEE